MAAHGWKGRSDTAPLPLGIDTCICACLSEADTDLDNPEDAIDRCPAIQEGQGWGHVSLKVLEGVCRVLKGSTVVAHLISVWTLDKSAWSRSRSWAVPDPWAHRSLSPDTRCRVTAGGSVPQRALKVWVEFEDLSRLWGQVARDRRR